MPRPLLLLDVDGVLNPYGGPCPPGYTEHDLFPGEEPVRVNREHGAWIAELAGEFDVTWATGWNDEANSVLGPLLGLPALPVLTMPPAPFSAADKVPRVAGLAQDRPAVWIDDLLTAAAWSWCRSRTTPTLLVPVVPAAGLARDAVDQALVWARALRPPPVPSN